LTIEQAVRKYLEDQRSHHRRPKTLEWHEHALELFRHYLLTEHRCLLLCQITEAQVRGWLAFLSQMRSARGSVLQTSTEESYARSARPSPTAGASQIPACHPVCAPRPP